MFYNNLYVIGNMISKNSKIQANKFYLDMIVINEIQIYLKRFLYVLLH